MNPHDEMRALTCHCGRIACRHHEDENPAAVTSGKTHHPVKGRTMTFNDEQIKQIEDRYGDTDLYEAFWATPTCDCKTRPWEDTIGAYDYTD